MSIQKSFYSDIVKKYFPNLVLQVAEQLNDKDNTAERFYCKEMLTPDFTIDTRWAGLLGKYKHVAADVVAMDSPLPLKSRGTLESVSGEIPKIGLKFFLSESEIIKLNALKNATKDPNRIIEKLFEDIPSCISGIYRRIEDLFLSELSTGIALSTRNDGTGVRLDIGYKSENMFGVTSAWEANPTTANAIDDIKAVLKKAKSKDHVLSHAWADETFLDRFCKNSQVKQQYAFYQGFVGSNIPDLDEEQVVTIFRRKFNLEFHKIDAPISTELNGVTESHNPWKTGVCVFTANTNVGSLVWTNVAEADDDYKVKGVDYQTADDFILVSKYADNDPLREYTAGQAMAFPVVNNTDRIYLLDSGEVMA